MEHDEGGYTAGEMVMYPVTVHVSGTEARVRGFTAHPFTSHALTRDNVRVYFEDMGTAFYPRHCITAGWQE